MAVMNYAAQYGKELANAYPYLSYFADLWNQGEAVRWRPLNGKTVYVPSMTTTGARAANRNQIAGTFNRNFDLEWQPCTMTMDREWDTLVDPMDKVETNEVATIANVTRTFNEQQKIPEQDAYMASKLAEYAGDFGGIDSTSLNSSNILAQWDAYLEYMTDHRINRDRIRCKMTPAIYKLFKEAAGLTRFVETAEGFRGIDRNFARLDGVQIQEVPSDMMKTAYDFTSGWAVAGGANQIGLILYDPMAIAAPIVYDTSMISPPTAQSKGKWLYYERYYYDVFMLNQRGAGIFAAMAAPSLGTLSVTSVAGTVANGDSVITVTGDLIGQTGAPANGLKLYYSANNASTVITGVTYGGSLPAGTWNEMTSNPLTLSSQTSGRYCCVCLVNGGKVVAAGEATEVVKA